MIFIRNFISRDIIDKSPHSLPKHRYSRYWIYCYITCACYFMSWIHNSTEKQSWSAHFAIVSNDVLFWLRIVTSPRLICDVKCMRDTGIVTSYSSIVCASANWHKDDIHLWITTVNIDFSPPGIHGLTCKKRKLLNKGMFYSYLERGIIILHTCLAIRTTEAVCLIAICRTMCFILTSMQINSIRENMSWLTIFEKEKIFLS